MKLFVLCFSIFLGVNASISPNGPQHRLSGGTKIDVNKYPFTVALLTNQGSGTFWQGCGGSILTTDAVLSAASCFDNEGQQNPPIWWRARVGTSFSNSGGSTHLISLITQHPDYDFRTMRHDLAVVRTVTPFVFSETIGPATIAGSALTFQHQQPVYAVGWGSDRVGTFKESQIWVVDQELCRNRYRGINFELTDDMMCAAWLDVGVRGQCEGDKGSPLVIDGVVAGVFSWAEGCAELWFPGINTKIGPYVRWIVSTARA